MSDEKRDQNSNFLVQSSAYTNRMSEREREADNEFFPKLFIWLMRFMCKSSSSSPFLFFNV